MRPFAVSMRRPFARCAMGVPVALVALVAFPPRPPQSSSARCSWTVTGVTGLGLAASPPRRLASSPRCLAEAGAQAGTSARASRSGATSGNGARTSSAFRAAAQGGVAKGRGRDCLGVSCLAVSGQRDAKAEFGLGPVVESKSTEPINPVKSVKSIKLRSHSARYFQAWQVHSLRASQG